MFIIRFKNLNFEKNLVIVAVNARSRIFPEMLPCFDTKSEIICAKY